MSLIAPEPLLTERLLIRLVEPRDLPALLAVNGDPQVTRHLPYATWAALAPWRAPTARRTSAWASTPWSIGL